MRTGRHSWRWRTRTAVPERGLDAGGAPLRSAALRGDALSVKRVSDSLQAEAARLTHRLDALAQLGRMEAKSRAPARWALGARFLIPTRDLSQQSNHPLTGMSARVEANVQGHQSGVGGCEPVEQRHEIAKRVGEVSQTDSHEHPGLSCRKTTECLRQGAALGGLIVHDRHYFKVLSVQAR